jgi:hypothetical protein
MDNDYVLEVIWLTVSLKVDVVSVPIVSVVDEVTVSVNLVLVCEVAFPLSRMQLALKVWSCWVNISFCFRRDCLWLSEMYSDARLLSTIWMVDCTNLIVNLVNKLQDWSSLVWVRSPKMLKPLNPNVLSLWPNDKSDFKKNYFLRLLNHIKNL